MSTQDGVPAGFNLVYSKKHHDLIGFILVSGEDIDDQAFVTTFLTKSNIVPEKITLANNLITFHHSLFESINFAINNQDAITAILKGDVVEYYAGFKDGTTPRIAFIKNGRNKEDVVFKGENA